MYMGGVEEEDEMSPSTERRFLGAVLTVEWLDGWTMVGRWDGWTGGRWLEDGCAAATICVTTIVPPLSPTAWTNTYPILRIAMSVCLLHWLSLASWNWAILVLFIEFGSPKKL